LRDIAVYTDLDPGLRRVMKADLVAMTRLKGRPFGLAGAIDVLALPGTCAVMLFRISSWAHHHHLKPVSRLVYFLNVVLFGCDIAPGALIGPGLAIGHPTGTTVTGNVTIGPRAVFTSQVGISGGMPRDLDTTVSVIIGSDVVFFHRATVLAGVSIGDGAVVGVNATVMKDVLPATVVMGSPARGVGSRHDMPWARQDDEWREGWAKVPSDA
jgi:serine O-acetyltransferase